MTKHGNDEKPKAETKSAAAKSDAIGTDGKGRKIAPPTSAGKDSHPINAYDWIENTKKTADESVDAKKVDGSEAKKLPGFDSKKLDAADLKKLDDADTKKEETFDSWKSRPRDHHAKREDRVAPSKDESET